MSELHKVKDTIFYAQREGERYWWFDWVLQKGTQAELRHMGFLVTVVNTKTKVDWGTTNE